MTLERCYKITEDRPNGLPPIVHTFHGFNQQFAGEHLEYVAIVFVEGSIETWPLESPLAITELKAYYNLREEQYEVLGVYKRV